MRYSIMVQLVATITFIFLGAAALFAWLQYRPGPSQPSISGVESTESRVSNSPTSAIAASC
jgi:hypothetical protein